MDGQKERQGDFVFTASETGEYRFCFNNEMSTFAEKFVDFEIAVSILPPKLILPADRFSRLKTRSVQQPYLRSKAPHQSKLVHWKNQF